MGNFGCGNHQTSRDERKKLKREERENYSKPNYQAEISSGLFNNYNY